MINIGVEDGLFALICLEVLLQCGPKRVTEGLKLTFLHLLVWLMKSVLNAIGTRRKRAMSMRHRFQWEERSCRHWWEMKEGMDRDFQRLDRFHPKKEK